MADTNEPVVLTTVPTEAEAAMIAAKLEDRGIDSHTTGALTSGLRAEAPGGVNILVHRVDLDRAQEALQESDEA